MKIELLKNHEGALILGGTHDFRSSHEIMHDLNERSPLIKETKKDFSWSSLTIFVKPSRVGATFESRKAEKGLRAVLSASRPYGRRSDAARVLGFIDTTKWHQVLAYSLEALIEDRRILPSHEQFTGPELRSIPQTIRA